MTDAITREETAAKRRSKKKLHNKIDRIASDISIIAGTLIAMARNEELEEADTLSHSAEFLGKEIKRRALKIGAIASYLHGRDLDKESNVGA
jgi:hypothetical protein